MPKIKLIFIIRLPVFAFVYPKLTLPTTLPILFIYSYSHLLNYLASKHMFL